MFEAFIFDIDGTLVDTREIHLDSWIRAFQKYGADIDVEDIQPQFGRRATEIAAEMLPDNIKDTAKQVADEKKRIFGARISEVKVFDKTKELLQLLHDDGLKIALATSTVKPEADYYVSMISVGNLLGAIVTAEDIEHSKPDPEIFLKAAKHLNVRTENCVGVGDSPHDMSAIKSAGMFAIGVLTGGFGCEELLARGADRIYLDINDLFFNIDGII